ncbi:hypothetical protein, conserved in T. vivax, partial [Trypanosoma vivax Y486]
MRWRTSARRVHTTPSYSHTGNGERARRESFTATAGKRAGCRSGKCAHIWIHARVLGCQRRSAVPLWVPHATWPWRCAHFGCGIPGVSQARVRNGVRVLDTTLRAAARTASVAGEFESEQHKVAESAAHWV